MLIACPKTATEKESHPLIYMNQIILIPPQSRQRQIDLLLQHQPRIIGHVDLPAPHRHAVPRFGGQEDEYDDLDGRVVERDRLLEDLVPRELELVEGEPVEGGFLRVLRGAIVGVGEEGAAFATLEEHV